MDRMKSLFPYLENQSTCQKCLLCDDDFTFPETEKQFLTHLYEKHRLIIGDVWKIANLPSYVHYWRIKFKEESVMNFCTTMLMDSTPDGKHSKNEVYYLLSDCLTEDKTLRDEIRRSKLELVLAHQNNERTDRSFKRCCMFCKSEFSGLRIEYLKHLLVKHNLQLGKLDNLVYVDKLLDVIQNNMENLICLYCEKHFKDRNVLKEHMRKKLHKRINPSNKMYDQFYVTNYLEPDSTWRQRQENQENNYNEQSDNEDEESLWADWNDESINVICLFCSTKSHKFISIIDHMKQQHNFDFQMMTNNLTFYEKVKVVNFIRQQISEKKCIYCDQVLENILEHMRKKNHFQIPSASVWNQPNFYFPTLETDSFLYHLDDDDDDDIY